MKSTTVQQTSHIRAYWYAWLGIAAVALVLRFTVFLGASEQRLFGLATAYGISTWLPIMALNFFEGRRLTEYLRIHHPHQWEPISHISFMGVAGRYGFRETRWLYSQDDFGDPVVASMKKDRRRFIRWALTVFFSYIVIMPVLLGL
ncbi:MAG TPA: hypothetical protein VN765_14885 [Candidatus Acidoferrum sp.]|nr:hypothetical protein [Candidatus Acidoferrum sp.]